jgi:hypothetical protein
VITTVEPPAKTIAFPVARGYRSGLGNGVNSGLPADDQQNNRWLAAQTIALIMAIATVICLVYCPLASSVFSNKGYMPYHSDESDYYQSAISYARNHDLRAIYVLDESCSRIGAFSTHGFAYTLFDGMVNRVFGTHSRNKIASNILLLISGLLAIGVIPWTNVRRRLTCILAILLCFMTPIWLFSYMQESVNWFIAIAFGFALMLVEKRNKLDWKSVLPFLALVTVGTIFRPNWMFFSLALIPYAKTRKQFFAISAISMASMAASVVITGMIAAPYVPGFLYTCIRTMADGGLTPFIHLLAEHTQHSFCQYFFSPDSLSWNNFPHSVYFHAFRWILCFAPLALIGYGIRTKDRPLAIAGTVALINIALLFVFYDTFGWRDLRNLTPLFITFIIVLARSQPLSVLLVLCAFFGLAMPDAIKTSSLFIAKHQQMAQTLEKRKDDVKAIQNLLENVTDTHDKYVICPYTMLNPDGQIYMLSLPVRTKNGVQLRYSFNASVTPVTPKRFDHILSNGVPTMPGVWRLIGRSKNLYLYECLRDLEIGISSEDFHWGYEFADGNPYKIAQRPPKITIVNVSRPARPLLVYVNGELRSHDKRTTTIFYNGKQLFTAKLQEDEGTPLHLKIIAPYGKSILQFKSDRPPLFYKRYMDIFWHGPEFRCPSTDDPMPTW